MLAGIFGFSLILELLVFYYALHFLFQNTPKGWVYLGVGLVVLFSWSDITSGRWADLFSGEYGFFWDEIFRTFGF